MKNNILKNSLKLNLSVLWALGLYPSEKHSYAHKCFSYIVHTFAVLPTFVLGVLNIFLNGAVEREMQNDLVTAGVIVFGPKLFLFLLNRDNVQECIKYFDEVFEVAANDTQGEIIEKYDKICRRNSTFFLIGVIFALLALSVIWYLQDFQKHLPLNAWLPFDFETHRVLYCSVYFTLIVGTAYVALGCAAIDPLVAGLLCYASGQLKMLKNNLWNLDFYDNEKTANFSSQMNRTIVVYSKITSIVLHYKKIIQQVFKVTYRNEFNEIVLVLSIDVKIAFLLWFFVNLWKACCLLGCVAYSRIQDFNAYFLLGTVLFLGLILFQVYFYCYYGTIVFEENNNVCTAIYMTNWYEYDIASRRALLILMERSKRPMLLTAEKVLDLSLATFTTILKSSYSLIAVLKNY